MYTDITARTRSGPVLIAVTAAVLTLFGTLLAANPANAAESHTITVDNGRLTMGYVFLDNEIIPAGVPGPLNPMIANTSANGSIVVQTDGSSATVAESDFKMPVVSIPDPTAGGAPIPMTFGPVGDLTGTWDAATGKLELTGTLRVNVYTGWDENGPKICQFNASNITWTTEPNAISPGVPFNTPDGLDGDGALSASWLDLQDGVPINGGACGKPNAVVHDPGAVWLSSGIAHFPDPPTCQDQGMDGLWPDCEEIEFPEPDPVVDITRVKIAPARTKLRAGGKVKLKIRVTNEGNKTGKVTVRLKVNRKKGVRLARKVVINVGAGKTAVRSVTFRTTRKARGKFRVTATGAGKSGSAVVKVKAPKKKRK